MRPDAPSDTRRVHLPISIRLTLWYALSLGVLIALFGGVLVTSFHRGQHTVLHQRLFKAQTELVPDATIRNGRPSLHPPLSERGGTFQVTGSLGTYARLLDPSGRVLDRSPNFDSLEAFTPVVPERAAIAEISTRWGEWPVRALYVPLHEDRRLAGWLEVSGYAWSPEHTLLGLHTAAGILLTMLLALAGGYLLARHALRPVARLTEAANRITASDLSVRLGSNARFRDEMTDLAETFNRMIARLESSFRRERRFTADAAHELKNPLAALRNEAEVTLRRDRDPEAYRRALETILTDARRLGTLVDQLLELAHIEAAPDAEPEATDAFRLGTEAVQRWQQRAPAHRIGLAPGCTGPVRLSAHPTRLTTILDNLLENALKYTPEGGRIELCILQEGNEAVLSVTDTGIGFDPVTASRLFDRFYRAGTPAVQAQPGSGLGLAIVQAIVHHYGGTLAVHSDGPGWGSTFEVRIPIPA